MNGTILPPTWRCRDPGGSHRLQNGWGAARRGPWWVRLPYASAGCVVSGVCAVINTMVLEVFQNYASYFSLQNYASHGLQINNIFHYYTNLA